MSDELDTRPPKKLKSTGSSAALFFTRASEKPKSDLTWSIAQTSLLTARYKASDLAIQLAKSQELDHCIKLASFDLDGTLIKTKSGNSFAKDELDWSFLDIKVPRKLRELSESGYVIVIISNQAGLTLTDTGKRYTQFKRKIEAIVLAIDVPVLVYAATAHDKFRKPRTGMYTRILDDLTTLGNTAVLVDHGTSFFVGDAAGRPASMKNTKKDFSASDRKFALNVKLDFHTPEEYFLDRSTSEFELDGFDPRKFENPSKTDHLFIQTDACDVVLLVGSPAAGKSSYFDTFLAPLDYIRINQDTLKTRAKCLSMAREALVQGRSICVDNTNASRETRKCWLDLAQELGKEASIPVRIVHFTADLALCEHNNAVRAFSRRDEEEMRELLPKIAFTSFKGRYEPPTLEEGFASIITVPFVLTGSPKEQENWRQYWT